MEVYYPIIHIEDERSHRLRRAFFSEDAGPMPPDQEGYYVLLSRNRDEKNLPGSHTTLWVGWSSNPRNRMFDYSKLEKYKKAHVGVGRYPHDVLFALESERKAGNPREVYEELLHHIFVPKCSKEFRRAKAGGIKNGRTDQVILDEKTQRLIIIKRE